MNWHPPLAKQGLGESAQPVKTQARDSMTKHISVELHSSPDRSRAATNLLSRKVVIMRGDHVELRLSRHDRKEEVDVGAGQNLGLVGPNSLAIPSYL